MCVCVCVCKKMDVLENNVGQMSGNVKCIVERSNAILFGNYLYIHVHTPSAYEWQRSIYIQYVHVTTVPNSNVAVPCRNRILFRCAFP